MTVQISTLDNGIRVVTDAMPHLETTALGIWVRAGARDEAPEQNGIAHLLEHMAFKGTGRRSALAIAEEIEAAGGEINASTAMETTTYYARVLKDDWLLGLDILCDILTDPVFDEAELAREKDVILQEIAAALDTPDDLVFDLAQQAAYGAHPLGRSILGTPDLVQSHSSAEIGRYRDANYAGGRIVVSAAGHIDHDRLVAETAARLGAVEPSAGGDWAAPDFLNGLESRAKPVDQAHVVLGFPGLSYRDEDIYALQLLANILGGGMSSRLFQQVREQRGLCYSVFAFASAYADSGLLSVYAATAPDRVNELIGVTSDVMLSVCAGITEQELQRAKAQIKSALVMNLESAAGRADQIARQLQAFDEVRDIPAMLERIERIDVEQLQRMAETAFTGRQLAMGAAGDLSHLDSYAKIAARFN